MKISEQPGDEESGLTCRTYIFQNESHTLGNALKCIISRYEDVQFCGYTVPHPAEAKMHFRIQTHETPALDVLKRGLKDLQKVCDHTIELFEKEVKDFKSLFEFLLQNFYGIGKRFKLKYLGQLRSILIGV